ncbi:hypothetical protein FQR65_LT06036 [Abscondita terminalis]|nr:hypothetical protein FQR65_LT06036 [Abscondita terminalis]
MGQVKIVEAKKRYKSSAEVRKKVAARRPTMPPGKERRVTIVATAAYKRAFRWWQKPSVKYAELEQEFWKTLELLVGKDRKRTEKDVLDDVQDWVDKFVLKKDNDEHLLTGSSKKSDESSGYGSGHSKEVKRFLKRINIPETDCK